MTLSTPAKLIAFAGLALILGAAGVLLLAAKPHKQSPAAATAMEVVHVKALTVRRVSHPPKPKLQLDASLPIQVRAKLRRSREVVAFVYTGASGSDRALAIIALLGAHRARVPFVGLDVTNEHTADAVFGWASSSADPQMLVVKRPGKIVFQLSGPIDAQTVAQAAISAK